MAAIDDRGSIFNQDVIAAIELGYMLDVAETIVVGAIERKECRGAQWRTDFPGRNDDEWLKHIDISMNGADVPQVSYSPVTITRWQPEDENVYGPLHTRARKEALMPEYTLRIRRYDPQSGEAPHWDTHTVELSPVQSVLDAILKIKDDTDGSIGIRCSCQQAICGSCGVRMNGKPGLACNTHLEEAAAAATARAGTRPTRAQETPVITVEPMGNMPVIRDLIVDMDAVHWKKIQRVTPWLINKEPVPEREYIVPHENMVDVTQTMACIQCGACVSDCLSMEVDPLFVGPAALAKAYRFVGDPRDAQHHERLQRPVRGPARDLRLHPLLQLHRRLPQGRGPDEPDHAPAPHSRLGLRHRGPQQRLPPRARVRQEHPPERPAARGRSARRLLRRQVPPGARCRS